MFIKDEIFSNIIENTPLVSIDFIVEDREGRVLVGKRINRPAKGFWFVPGGRIRKNETIEDAFKRLTLTELGEEVSLQKATLIGVYTHKYMDSIFGDTISTHYVALGYRFKIDRSKLELPIDEQHDMYQWMTISKLMTNNDVHENTKRYFVAY